MPFEAFLKKVVVSKPLYFEMGRMWENLSNVVILFSVRFHTRTGRASDIEGFRDRVEPFGLAGGIQRRGRLRAP